MIFALWHPLHDERGVVEENELTFTPQTVDALDLLQPETARAVFEGSECGERKRMFGHWCI